MYLVVDSAVIGLCLRLPAMQELPLGESTWLSLSSSSSFPYAISALKNSKKTNYAVWELAKNVFWKKDNMQKIIRRDKKKSYFVQKSLIPPCIWMCSLRFHARCSYGSFFFLLMAFSWSSSPTSLSSLSPTPFPNHQYILIMFCTWNSHTAHLFSPVTAFSRSHPLSPLLVLSHQF